MSSVLLVVRFITGHPRDLQTPPEGRAWRDVCVLGPLCPGHGTRHRLFNSQWLSCYDIPAADFNSRSVLHPPNPELSELFPGGPERRGALLLSPGQECPSRCPSTDSLVGWEGDVGADGRKTASGLALLTGQKDGLPIPCQVFIDPSRPY